jgi:protein-disulfide isomerase
MTSSTGQRSFLRGILFPIVAVDDIQLGQDKDLQGVPTFFINGKADVGFDKPGLFDAIDQAISE